MSNRLEDEYSPKAALQAVERARRNEQKRVEAARRMAEPIADVQALDQAVNVLAQTIGGRVRRPRKKVRE